jgi:hypothetical protein
MVTRYDEYNIDFIVIWMLEKATENSSFVTFAIEIDPKGSVPNWAVNYFTSHMYGHNAKMRLVLEQKLQ